MLGKSRTDICQDLFLLDREDWRYKYLHVNNMEGSCMMQDFYSKASKEVYDYESR